MKRINLANTQNKVSQLCLGCMMMGTAMDKETSFEVLDHFVELGGNFLDTANCYAWWMGKGEFIGDESENVIGEWLRVRKCRHDIVLATKVGGRLKDPHGIRDASGVPEWHRVKEEYEGLSDKVIRKGVEDSLKRLNTDYIDLYFAHVFDEKTPLDETMETFNDLIKEGKIRSIGCSNINVQQIQKANAISRGNFAPYVAMQQEYSYLHPNPVLDNGIIEHADSQMFECMKQEDMAFMAYSPLLKGIYGDRKKREQYYNWHLFNNEPNLKKLELVEKISNELGITGNQLVLAWLLRHDPQIIPLIGFSRKEQYMENIKAADIRLSDTHFEMLNALDK